MSVWNFTIYKSSRQAYVTGTTKTTDSEKRKKKRSGWYKKLHEEYLRQAGTCENDCRYILKAAVMLAQEEIGTFWKIEYSRCETGSRVIRLGNV